MLLCSLLFCYVLHLSVLWSGFMVRIYCIVSLFPLQFLCLLRCLVGFQQTSNRFRSGRSILPEFYSIISVSIIYFLNLSVWQVLFLFDGVIYYACLKSFSIISLPILPDQILSMYIYLQTAKPGTRRSRSKVDSLLVLFANITPFSSEIFTLVNQVLLDGLRIAPLKYMVYHFLQS